MRRGAQHVKKRISDGKMEQICRAFEGEEVSAGAARCGTDVCKLVSSASKRDFPPGEITI